MGIMGGLRILGWILRGEKREALYLSLGSDAVGRASSFSVKIGACWVRLNPMRYRVFLSSQVLENYKGPIVIHLRR
jgi:hypothetical protein